MERRLQLSSITTKKASNLIINMASEYFKVIEPSINMIHTYVESQNLLFAGYLNPDDILLIIDDLIAIYYKE